MMTALLLALLSAPVAPAATAYEPCQESSDCDEGQSCGMNAQGTQGYCETHCETLDSECPAHRSGEGTPTCDPTPCDIEGGECGGRCQLNCEADSNCPNEFSCVSGICYPNGY